MPTNFYLKSSVNKNGESPIQISVCIKSIRVMTTIGYSISREKWDSKHSSVRRGYSNSDGILGSTINERILALESAMISYENQIASDEYPTKDEILRKIAEVTKSVRTAGPSVIERMEEFIVEQSFMREWSDSTKKKYRTIVNHMREFSPDIKFRNLTEATLIEYVRFLYDTKHMLDISVKKDIKLLKSFLRWATKKGYNKQLAYQDFRPIIKDIAKPVIFLTPEEILKIKNYIIPEDGTTVKLKDMNGKEYEVTVKMSSSLEKTRDLFLFCVYTGLRYSDMAKLKKSDIVDGHIRVVTQKTRVALTLVETTQSSAIIEKYKNCPGQLALPVISNQKMNEYLKQLCELCGLNAKYSVTVSSNGKRQELTGPKYSFVTTHVARRSFVCTALQAGIPLQVVMSITGHSSFEEMKPYISITTEQQQREIAKFTKLIE